MTIRLDKTAETVVILCSQCPGWRELRLTVADAWIAGASHDSRAHPGNEQAADMLRKIRPRTA